MKSIVLSIVLFVSLMGCSTDAIDKQLSGTFSSVMLDNVEIFEFRVFNDHLYTGTEEGLHRIDLNTQEHESFMTDGHVRTFLILAEDNWIVPVSFPDNPDETGTIYKSIDQGENWIPFRNGYGGNTSIIPLSMDGLAENPSVIFASTGNVARSTNGGHSWESVFLSWNVVASGRVVKIDRSDESVIWAGGANTIFQPVLVMSDDGGDDWERLEPHGDSYLEAPIYDIVIHRTISSRVMVSLGGSIVQTNDFGQNWEFISSDIETGIRTLTTTPSNEETVYASGIHPSGKIALSVTTDFGDSWETFLFENGPGDVDVNDLIAVDGSTGSEVIYIGTDRGIYSFTMD